MATANIPTFTSFENKAAALDKASAANPPPTKEAPKNDQSPTQASTKDTPKAPEAKNPVADSIAKIEKKYKVKIDGAESEVDEDELIRSYQLRQTADKRMQEATQARKQAEEFVHLLKHDPVKLLTDPRIGHDMKKIAEDYLISQLEEEQMTPEQKELKKTKAELQKYESWKKEQEEAAVRSRDEQLTQHYQNHYQQEIITALEGSGLPKTQGTVNRMIYYMSQALQNGYELSAKDVTDLVMSDYVKETRELYQNVPEEVLLKLLGDDVAKKVVKSDLNKLKKNPAASAPKSPTSPKTKPYSQHKISIDTWKDRLEKIKRGEE